MITLLRIEMLTRAQASFGKKYDLTNALFLESCLFFGIELFKWNKMNATGQFEKINIQNNYINLCRWDL